MSLLQIEQAGKFLKEQLRIIEPGIMRTEYPELWGANGKYHTVRPGLPFGAKEILYARVDHAGIAVNFGGRATDIPVVNFGIDTQSNKTLMGVLGAEWHWEELQQQEMAERSGNTFSINVVQEYRAALEKGIQEWIHLRTLWGIPSEGFRGLFTNADIEVKIITDNLYTMSANDLYDFFVSESFDFQKDTKLTSEFTDMIIPIDLKRAMQKRFADNNDGNVGRLLLGVGNDSASYRSISTVNELSYQYLVDNGVILPGDNQDMFMMYENSPDVVDKLDSGIYRTPVGLCDDQMTYRITAITKISEVRCKRPYKVRYYKIPKAA